MLNLPNFRAYMKSKYSRKLNDEYLQEIYLHLTKYYYVQNTSDLQCILIPPTLYATCVEQLERYNNIPMWFVGAECSFKDAPSIDNTLEEVHGILNTDSETYSEQNIKHYD